MQNFVLANTKGMIYKDEDFTRSAECDSENSMCMISHELIKTGNNK